MTMDIRQETVLLAVRDGQIILGLKKPGRFGEGKWNGYGGGVEEGETIEETAIRELFDESSLIARKEDLIKVADVLIYFDVNLRCRLHFYTLAVWQGEPQESNEMIPKVFSLADIPYDQMWKSDRIILPEILKGKKLKGRIVYDDSGDMILNKVLAEVENFD